MVLEIYKALRPNLRVYSGYSILFFGVFFFYIILFWYHFSIYRLMSSGGKEQQPKKPVCSCLNVGHFQGKDKGSTWFLKSPKAPSQNVTWLAESASHSSGCSSLTSWFLPLPPQSMLTKAAPGFSFKTKSDHFTSLL